MDDDRMKALAQEVRAAARAISSDMGWRGDAQDEAGRVTKRARALAGTSPEQQ
jgi:hypothetical protein